MNDDARDPSSVTQKRPTIKIGSQRDTDQGATTPDAVEPSTPSELVTDVSQEEASQGETAAAPPDGARQSPPSPVATAIGADTESAASSSVPRVIETPEVETSEVKTSEVEAPGAEPAAPELPRTTVAPLAASAVELQREVDAVLGGMSIDDLLNAEESASPRGAEPEPESRLQATVAKVHRENVFFALPGRYEGVASLRQFAEPPKVGAVLEVIVVRYAPDEGLYELHMPGASVSVGDWSDVDEGIVVEALISGHNSGGLECEVNKLRGFIPISQIALYRVDDVEQFVGEKWACVVTEANPAKGNLVLSRRAMLEREREASREQLLASLEVGQVRQGVVRSLRDFGAFVDLGGVDGLIHISKLSWDRVAHPSEVLEEGQQVEVKIDKLEPATGKISLSYRDLQASPWSQVDQQFPVGGLVTGTVSRIMDFGAFVRLAAGVEGLIHISELSHQRINRVSQAVSEGQTLEVKIVSVDAEAQRIALSLKAAQAQVAITEKETTDEPDELDEETRERMANIKAQQKPLKGGTDRPTGGESLGLNW